mgnify:CR=1 FL=1
MVSGVEADSYEGMRTTHSHHFCLHKTLVVNNETINVENEAHFLFLTRMSDYGVRG